MRRGSVVVAGTGSLEVLAEVKRVPKRLVKVVNRLILPVDRKRKTVLAVDTWSERPRKLHGHPLAIPRRKVNHGKHDTDVVGLVGHSGVPQAQVTDDNGAWVG